MKLRHLLIENFRGIRRLDLDLDDTTVLIGENNSGKTAVLDAMKLCLRDLGSRRRVIFEPYDLHLKDEKADPAEADPIRIELTFLEKNQREWDGQLTGRLTRLGILQADPDDGHGQVTLRVTCAYDAKSRDLSQNWAFLNLNGQELPEVPENALRALREEISYFYLSALRDAGKHFDAKGEFWRPFLKDSQLSPEKRAEIEAQLRAVNDLIVASHESFDQAKSRLQRLQDVVPIAAGEVVSIEAVPGRLFDMLAKAQIHLGTSTGAKIPVGRHGEGTQSLAVLMLFSAFLDAWPSASPIVGLEEPEAHLHPSAIRALWKLLDGIAGQKVISTHSGDLLSEVDVHQIRRLAKTRTGIVSRSVDAGLLNPEETRKFNYHVRRARGELLFARCWLLVEGETEAWVYPAAAQTLGMDLHREGVRVVEYSQSDVGLLTKVANALGIPWYCVIDDDSGRTKYEASLQNNLDGAKPQDRYVAPYRNAETHLLACGFDTVYSFFMPQQNLAKIASSPGDAGYWAEYADKLPGRAKTRAAAAVAVEITTRGPACVTVELTAVLNRVVKLAQGDPP
jgi:putative ATP-dependent endonuclease of the OLD family